MIHGDEPITVTLPADVAAAREIYDTDPLVKTLVDVNARAEGVDPDEYLCTVAGGVVSATAGQLGLVGSEPPEYVEVTLTGAYDE